MALNRVWRPSPNFSGPRARNQVVVLHTSEGATTESSLAGFLAQSSSRVSYNVLFDDFGDVNTITECVRPPNAPWAAMAANNWGPHGCLCTPSGASAGWNEATWSSKRTMLAKAGRWVAEECARYGIPVVKVDGADIRAGRRGVCGHADVTNAGAGGSHFDPGPRFVWSELIRLAAGGVAPPPTEETDLTPDESTLLRQIHESIPMLRDIQARLRDGISGAGADKPNAFGSLQTIDWRIRDLFQRVEAMENKLSGK